MQLRQGSNGVRDVDDRGWTTTSNVVNGLWAGSVGGERAGSLDTFVGADGVGGAAAEADLP